MKIDKAAKGARTDSRRSIRLLPILIPLLLWAIPREAIPSSSVSPPLSDASAMAHPYRLHWALDAPLLLGGLAVELTGGRRLRQMESVDLGTLDRGSLRPWDRPFAGTYSSRADLASDIVALGILAPIVVSLWDSHSGRQPAYAWMTDIVLFTEVLLWNSGLNLITRSLEVHPRPLVFGDDVPLKLRTAPEAAGSFYSGHASAGFATAVFFGYTHALKYPGAPENRWIWLGGLSAASTVAALRVAAGKHYPSDVVAGAAIGSFIGLFLPWVHLQVGDRAGSRGGKELARSGGFAGRNLFMPSLRMNPYTGGVELGLRF